MHLRLNYINPVLAPMITARGVATGFHCAAKAMSAAAGSSPFEPPEHCLPGVQETRPGSPPQLRRLVDIPGCQPDRVNDLLLLSNVTSDSQGRCGSDTEDRSAHVVFFPGDIQNFQQEMSLQPEGGQWLSWSLENVALTLGRRFPERHVWVIRASRMYLHKFSCYHNFVESNLFGAPEHSPDYGAFRHLRALLSNGMERAGLPNPLPLQRGGDTVAPGFSLAVVGFSKGCVVLNQLVYELARARADPELGPFVECLSDMYWLDGGHPGGSETWVTDKRALRELAASGVAVHAHVTPYEVRDPMRAWVGREHGRFVKKLEDLGARLSQKMHFEDEPASIENHFRIIQDF
ncbi:mitochondrial protein C2orf69 homolog isoform X1 [Oncorhynchus keta]|uniref:mitochondrial protein C2orf69 homolog isoform X1 n=2 Tax=Oncorhynchus keta TaxID=8018 RepID=UPI0015FB693B|nr:mitochondrial protein C2orf69 homolog isoform X1 [Oncorhynchus keta]